MKQDLKAGVINVSPRNWIWSVFLYLRSYCCCCLFSLLACTGFWFLILILIHVGMACSLLFAKGPMTAYAHIQLHWKHSSPVLKQWGWFSQEFVNIGPITLESILECAPMHGWNPWGCINEGEGRHTPKWQDLWTQIRPLVELNILQSFCSHIPMSLVHNQESETQVAGWVSRKRKETIVSLFHLEKILWPGFENL